MRKVHQFLAANRDKAFTEAEIVSEVLNDVDAQASSHLFTGPIVEATRYRDQAYSPAIMKLVEAGAVQSKRVRGSLYFAYRRDLAA
jgi:hypothetical protein